MKTLTAERNHISFRGILRTPQGSVILIAIENMPISPVDTYYPETTYNANGSTTIKHIFLNGLLIATVTSGTVRYVSGDLLGGSNVVTNASGTLVETLQYFPYGKIRVDNTAGSYSGEARKYIGQEYDAATALSYLNARYYNGSQGQFLSEDPVFLTIGNSSQVKQLTLRDQGQFLANPQTLNSYGYSAGNPITGEDPKGLDSYYNNFGNLVGSDARTNGMFFQSNDASMLSSNLLSVTSHGNPISNFGYWLNQVRPGGAWDYKTSAAKGGREYYFFNGQFVNANDFGNLNYGYTGAAIGIGPSILVDAGGAVEAYDVGRTNTGISIGNIQGNFNAPGNTANIQGGIGAYNSSRGASTVSKASQAGSNIAYGVAGGPSLARLVTLLTALVQTLRAYIGGK